MRRFEIAMTTLVLRASPTKPPEHAHELAPAVDKPAAALLDRSTISQQHAALVASLWPEPVRQCVARPRYEAQAAPAIFGRLHAVSWPAGPHADARALQQRLADEFASETPEKTAASAHAA